MTWNRLGPGLGWMLLVIRSSIVSLVTSPLWNPTSGPPGIGEPPVRPGSPDSGTPYTNTPPSELRNEETSLLISAALFCLSNPTAASTGRQKAFCVLIVEMGVLWLLVIKHSLELCFPAGLTLERHHRLSLQFLCRLYRTNVIWFELVFEAKLATKEATSSAWASAEGAVYS